MQSGLQIFDMPIKGDATGKTQKIAIKTSDHNLSKATNDDSFNAIMNTLMALSPEQLETSLNQLEWVPIDENVSMFAPLIDLSGCANGGAKTESADRLFALLENGTKNNSPLWPNATSEGAKPFSNFNPNMPPLPAEPGLGPLSNDIGAPQHNMESFGEKALDGTAALIGGGDPKGLSPHLDNPNSYREMNMMGLSKNANPLADETTLTNVRDKNSDQTNASAAHQEFNKAVESKLASADKMARHDDMSTSQFSDAKEKIGPDVQSAKKVHFFKSADPSSINDEKGLAEDVEKRFSTDKQPGITSTEKRPLAKLQVEQFKSVSDAVVTGNDKGVNAINQMNETTLKESVRNNFKSVSSPVENSVNKEIKPDQVQPNSSIKDAAFSFSSRWGAMLEKNIEVTNDAKPAESAPDRTQQNEVIRQIVQRMTLKSNRLQSQMNIKLKPEFLGNIRMQITSDNQQVVVRMVADSNGVKEMIEQNIQYLKAELQQHGLEIDKFDVFVGSDNDELRQEQQAQLRQRAKQKGEGSNQNKDLEKDMDGNESADKKNAMHQSTSSSEIDYFV